MQNMNIFVFTLKLNIMNYHYNNSSKIDLFTCNINVCPRDVNLIMYMLHIETFVFCNFCVTNYNSFASVYL